MYYSWQMLEQIARGEMPPGMTEADLRAMEMPVPGEIELIEKPDGAMVIRKVEAGFRKTSPPESGSARVKLTATARGKKSVFGSAAKATGRVKAGGFACDSPDDR